MNIDSLQPVRTGVNVIMTATGRRRAGRFHERFFFTSDGKQTARRSSAIPVQRPFSAEEIIVVVIANDGATKSAEFGRISKSAAGAPIPARRQERLTPDNRE
jgi:hypothetical protein